MGDVVPIRESGGYSILSDEADPDDATSVEEVLEHAKERGLQRVVVIGLGEDREMTVASSDPSIADVIFLLEHAKQILLGFGLEGHPSGDS